MMMCFYDLNSPINFRWVRLPAGIGTGAGAPLSILTTRFSWR